ncbi:hypothetical protein AURDEDRAFT_161099 [Auricularia subglabra TFB-10046 SS5]|nr:hypothetical protein AURDEDRAFT_161099 [Auricularia subglabra TFB-10046 SS5]
MAEESQSPHLPSTTLDNASDADDNRTIHSRSTSPEPSVAVATIASDDDVDGDGGSLFDLALTIPLLDDPDEDLEWYAGEIEDGPEEDSAGDGPPARQDGGQALEGNSVPPADTRRPPAAPKSAIPPASDLAARGVNTRALASVVLAHMDKKVIAVDVVSRDEWRKACNVRLEDGSEVTVLVYKPSFPKTVVESELATMNFIATKTTIPVPRVLHYSAYNSRSLGPYAILEKAGVRLDIVFDQLPPFEQELIVVQYARWVVELSKFHFPSIGSLKPSESPYSSPVIGPLLHLPFFASGRAGVPLDRGPFPSTREYFLACAQREIDSARALFTQGETSVDYQRQVEDTRMQAERAAAMMMNIIECCPDLENDPELEKFALDIHDLAMKSFIVDPTDPTRVVAITDWHKVTTRPLWRCAQLPRWIGTSSVYAKDDDKERLETVYRAAVSTTAGFQSAFVRAMDSPGDTRHALDDACDYDAITDGFLLLPTLESIAATLPGSEDTNGLAALLDPTTLSGRAARINLMTKGEGTLALVAPKEEPLKQKDWTVNAGTSS